MHVILTNPLDSTISFFYLSLPNDHNLLVKRELSNIIVDFQTLVNISNTRKLTFRNMRIIKIVSLPVQKTISGQEQEFLENIQLKKRL